MSKTVQAFRVTLIVDQRTREFISEAAGYANSGELFEYEKDVEEIEWQVDDDDTPRCDVCNAIDEEVDWCGSCGCCVEHCQDFEGCGDSDDSTDV